MNIIYENCRVNNYMKEDHRSYRRNFCSCEKKPEKKIFDLLSYNSYITMYYYHYVAVVERFTISAGINIPLCPATAEGKAKVKKTGMFLSEYSGSSPNGHSRNQTALLTTAFTKPHFSQLPYKLCI